MPKKTDLASLCRRVRADILASTTTAGSGHPTSSLSAVELMATLFFGGFLRQNTADPHSHYNDKVILSKGHAAPLLYSLYEVAGVVTQKELLKLRSFTSPLQGHPVPAFPFVDVATGSLGQGLSVGVGMALGIRLMLKQKNVAMKREPTVWVLLGDSESAEGQVWEAMAVASKYNLNNLVAIIDVNRLGQNSETELGWDIDSYRKRAESFGWETTVIKNGHNLDEVRQALEKADRLNTVKRQKPIMIVARTVKGKGVSFLENQEGWHGKPVPKDKLPKALKELGKIDYKQIGEIEKPEVPDERLEAVLNKLDRIMLGIGGDDVRAPDSAQSRAIFSEAGTGGKEIVGRIYSKEDKVATREAFGQALLELGRQDQRVVALDAEVGNSTYLNIFGKEFPERYFEIYIDEENMASIALGLSKMGFIPYFSTFAAFLTRAFDQMRMMQYSMIGVDSAPALLPASARKLRAVGEPLRPRHLPHLQADININIIGSHAGVSIGQDGPSQMGLEDLAMMRSIRESTVLYPSDAASTQQLVMEMNKTPGIKYMRTTRGKTPVIYKPDEKFPIGDLKLHVSKNIKSSAVIFAAGITLHEAIKAQKELAKIKVYVTVVDLYTVKPLNVMKIKQIIGDKKKILIVEDHYEYGGIGEAMKSALTGMKVAITHLCVRKTPRSGSPEELLAYEELDAASIVKAIHFV